MPTAKPCAKPAWCSTGSSRTLRPIPLCCVESEGSVKSTQAATDSAECSDDNGSSRNRPGTRLPIRCGGESNEKSERSRSEIDHGEAGPVAEDVDTARMCR